MIDHDPMHMHPAPGAAPRRPRSRALLLAATAPAALLFALASGGHAGTAGLQEPAPREKGDEPAPPPRIGPHEGARLDYAVGSQTHKFGSLMQGAVASHVFKLTARGTEELIISNIKPTCGCTVAEVQIQTADGELKTYTYGDAIPIGSNLEVPAKLHTKGRHGHQNTRINIFSNDPRGQIQLGLEADILPFFTVNPRFLNFNRLQLGDVQTQQALITTTGNQPILLTLVDPSIPSGAKTELVPLNPGEDGKSSRWQLTVTLGPDLVEGNLARQLVLKSDVRVPEDDHPEDHTGHNHAVVPHTEFYEAQLTISAQIVGPFSYQPNYLSMGLVRPGQVVARTIRIECNDDNYRLAERKPNIRIVGLPIPGGEGYQEWEHAEYFSYVLRPVENENAIDLELRLEGLPDAASGSFRGMLLVELDHPDKKMIDLTITGVCRGGPIPPRPELPAPRPSGRD